MKYLTVLSIALGNLMFNVPNVNAQDQETRSLDSFDGISVSASINAELRKGSKNEVKIMVENHDLDDVETEIRGGVLKIGMKKNSWNSWGSKSSKKRRVNVVVTYTETLEFLSASSSSDLIAKDVISSDELELVVSSSADMTVEVNVDELVASVSSSGDLVVSGSAKKGSINTSSSADFVGDDLTIDMAELKASSSSDITVRVQSSLEAKATSSADITYYGNPSQKDVKKSSGGSIDRKN